MNAFEHIAARFFEAQSYWTRVGLKISVTKAEKRAVGKLRHIFSDNRWLLVTPSELAQGLRKFAERGYEDEIVTMVVKILERNAFG